MVEPKTELQRNAIAEARKQELVVFQRSLDMKWLDDRMEDGRMGRLMALIKQEADMEKEYRERTDHAALVNAQATKEANLAMEIAEVRREENCQFLRRHYLRERDPSLRDLQKKLLAGYVCRDVQQQILHNQYKRLEDKAAEKRANDQLQKALHGDKEALLLEEKATMERQAKYRQDLQQQLVTRQVQRQCQYEESLIEKKMLDDVLKTLADEDKRELDQKRMLMERTRSEMKTFEQARMAWREKQKKMVISEEKEIEKQAKELAARTSNAIEERNRLLREREESNARIAAKVLAAEEKRQERIDLINELQLQEYYEKNHQDDLAEKRKSENTKKDMLDSLNAQVEFQKREREAQKRREMEFRLQTEAKVKAEEEKERLKEIERRKKRQEYAAELKAFAERGMRKKEEFKKEEEARAKNVFEFNKRWDEEVQKERQSMIREHAPPLLGYLQAATLQKEDLPAVREGANRHESLAKLDIEGMANTANRPPRFSKCNAQCRIIREY